MLRRQRLVLALLAEAKRALVRPVVGHLVFLLRQESPLRDEATGYDFVPYASGPCSFTLDRELASLQNSGFLSGDGGRLKLAFERLPESRKFIQTIPRDAHSALESIVGHYGRMSREALVEEVSSRYPWYAAGPLSNDQESRKSSKRPKAVYTAGYEHCSAERFLGGLLKEGVQCIADVRANPMSRKFGFGRSSLSEIAGKLGLEYLSFPTLGIPSRARAGLDGFASYQRLLDSYEREVLRRNHADILALAAVARAKPTVLVCKEQEARYCHRSRLAAAVAKLSDLPVQHLDPFSEGVDPDSR